MSIAKKIKDRFIKAFYGKGSVPRGLFDLHEYFRIYKQIDFDYHNEDGVIVAVSKNFKQGSIVTSGANREDLDKNIKDAILTVFSVPSSYAKEAAVVRVGENNEVYALA